MQSSHDSLDGSRMIVLHKFRGQAERSKLIRPECFREKAATILKDLRYHDNHIMQISGFYCYAHFLDVVDGLVSQNGRRSYWRSVPLISVEKPADAIHEGLLFLGPCVCQVNLLPSLGGFHRLARMRKDIFDAPGKLFRVAGFEEEKGF